MKKRILYFYEYASEIKGKCVGHARIVAGQDELRFSLAFSLPEWVRDRRKVYVIGEMSDGEKEAVEAGSIIPADVLTVYNFGLELSKFQRINIMTACSIGIVILGDDRYIKAMSGVFDIDREHFLQVLEGKSVRKNISSQMTNNPNINIVEDDKIIKDVLLNNSEKKLDNKDTQISFSKIQSEEPIETLNKTQSEEPLKSTKNISISKIENEETSLPKRADDNPFENLLCYRTDYNPFTNKKIEKCVRISIGDINLLSEYEQGLKDNSFLIHGFYRYKHILFARDREVMSDKYYVLVPGLKIEKEQRLADMFGFHNFLTLDGQKPVMGGFGYYSWKLMF